MLHAAAAVVIPMRMLLNAQVARLDLDLDSDAATAPRMLQLQLQLHIKIQQPEARKAGV